MRTVDIIMKKRDGHALDPSEISAFVSGVTSGALPDYQASALLMAILLKGNYAKTELDDLAGMLGALAAEADWLAKGDDARFMSDVALRQQEE